MASVSAPPRPAPSADGDAPPLPAPRAGRTYRVRGRVGAARLVALEAAGVAVALAVLSGSTGVVITAGAGALSVLVVGFVRINGRCWYQVAAAGWRLRRRQGAARRAAGGQGPAHTLAPGFAVHGYDDRGSVLGIGRDAGGWFAAVALAPRTDLSGGRVLDVPLERLVRLLVDGGAPLSTVQLVSLSVPAPCYALARQVPCVESYRQLAADVLGDDPRPGEQQLWAAIRLTPGDAADAAAARGGGMEGVYRAVAAAIARLGTALGAADVPYQVLGPDQLLDAVNLGCGLERSADAGTAPAEQWGGFVGGGLAQVAFEVTGWVGEPTPTLLPELATVAAGRVVISVALRPSGDRIRVRAVVRVAATPSRLVAVSRAMTARAEQLGVRLRRLDGWHGPAVYASAPTGGGLL